MKKILSIVFILVIIMSGYIIFNQYSPKSFLNKLDIQDMPTIDVKETKNYVDFNEFIKTLQDEANKHGVSFSKVVFLPKENGKKTKVISYQTLTPDNKFQTNFKLSWAKKPISDSPFLSSFDTNDPNQTGKLKYFHRDFDFEIKPLYTIQNNEITGNYILNVNDKKLAEDISNVLKEKYKNLIIQTSFYTNWFQFNLNPLLLIGQILFILISYFIIIITFVYIISLSFKKVGIEKMFGTSNNKVILNMIKKEIFPHLAFGVVFSFILMLIALFFYNGFEESLQFIGIWLLYSISATIMLIILFFIIAQIIRLIPTYQMLKNKRAKVLLSVSNQIIKLSVFVAFIFLMIHTLGEINKISENDKYLNQLENITKNYASIDFMPNAYEHNNIEQRNLYINLIFEFYKKIEKKGAFVIYLSTYYQYIKKPDPYNEELYKKTLDYHHSKKSLLINENYLTINPVYDVNGKQITKVYDVNNKSDLILLVPEKYKGNDEDIIKDYKSWYLRDDKNKKVKIIYIKNDQNFITYKDPYSEKAPLFINDNPVLAIMNEMNMEKYKYEIVLSNQSLLVNIQNENNSIEPVKQIAKEVGLGNDLRIKLLYERYSYYINSIKQNISLLIVQLFSLILIFLMSNVFLVLNYIEENKKFICIKRLNGYSFLSRHKFLYLVSLASFIIVSIILLLFNLGYGVLFALSFFTIELITLTTVLKLKESISIIDTLKGE